MEKIFYINGKKIAAFIADNHSLNFSSQRYDTAEAFRAAWDKKLSLATKVKIKYDSIKSVRKEDNAKSVFIVYKSFLSIPGQVEFSFDYPEEYDVFFSFLSTEKFFTRKHERMTPFKAMQGYLLGFILTIALTIFGYYQAIDIANGTAEEAHSSKAQLFNYIVGALGDNGVIAVGALITTYLLYKMYIRFTNPPNQTLLLPPNA